MLMGDVIRLIDIFSQLTGNADGKSASWFFFEQ
jgi:hypothetical protein